jgi:phosphoribosyl 1,2-cyclic phosphodiesterase
MANIDPSFTIHFWGVRGSYPTPGPNTIRYGGNTPCVEVNAGGYTFILDSGTGIIPLGRELAVRSRKSGKGIEAVILFSHLHHDHTQGFPFFTPAFIPSTRLHLFGPDFLNSSPKMTLDTVMTPPYFPVRLAELNAWLSFSTVRETDMLLVGESVGGVALCNATDPAIQSDPDLVQVRILRSYAHPNGVLHYRIDWHGKSVVYATDTEGYVNGDRRLARFAQDANLLIHDAQYTDEHYLGLTSGMPTTQGYGHSTVSIACQAAQAAAAERLVLFHHAPEYSDDQLDLIAEQVQMVCPGTLVASEGLEISLIKALSGTPAAIQKQVSQIHA